MAEKKKKFFKTLGKFLIGEAYLVRQVEKGVDKTIHEAEKKIEHLTVKAIKASAVFMLILLGLIFSLVGLSNYLTSRYALTDGFGYIYVGLALIFLGWFARLIRA